MGMLRAQLFRENRGWVLVTPESWTEKDSNMVVEYWKRVSDLPIIVIMNTELLLDDKGSIVVKNVTFATSEKLDPVDQARVVIGKKPRRGLRVVKEEGDAEPA